MPQEVQAWVFFAASLSGCLFVLLLAIALEEEPEEPEKPEGPGA